MRYLAAVMMVFASSVFAATPNLALEWTGNPQDFGGDSFRLRCGSSVYNDAVSPTQLTDAAGVFVICGAGQVATLHVVNAFGEGPANGNLVMTTPNQGPAIMLIVLP